MRSIVFDAGPVISLALNNLIWLLKPLKKQFIGDFVITQSVKGEIIDRPIDSKKFKYEAIQIMKEVKEGTLTITNDEKVKEKTTELLDIANNIYIVENNPVKIVHFGEMECLAYAILNKSHAIVVDERTFRNLIEDPKRVKQNLEYKIHKKVKVDKKSFDKFKKEVKGIKLIRSVELAIIAYELGLFKDMMPEIEFGEQILLDGLLWGLKLNGCSLPRREIEDILRMEKARNINSKS